MERDQRWSILRGLLYLALGLGVAWTIRTSEPLRLIFVLVFMFGAGSRLGQVRLVDLAPLSAMFRRRR